MNIFKKIKRFFTNEVSLDGVPQNFITPYKLKGDCFKIGAKIIVPTGTALVVAIKNKVMEVINTGEYQVSSALMPNVAKKLELNKYDKYGKQKDSFNAKAYFVKTEGSLLFQTSNYRTLKFRQGVKSFFRLGFNGQITCKIEKVNKCFNLMFLQIPHLKEDSAEYMLELIINELLTDKLDKATYTLQDYENNSPAIKDYIESIVSNALSSVGFHMESLDISFVVKSKKIKQDKVQKEKKQKKTKEEKAIEKSVGKEIVEKIEVSPVNFEDEIEMYDDDKPKNYKKNKGFVDLNLEHLYDDSETKICPACGDANRVDAKICYKCGTKFGEE